MEADDFRALVARAGLAPSVHNIQPARWRMAREGLLVGSELASGLAASDSGGRDAGLSCGAAVEAMVLALSATGRGATVTDLWGADDRVTMPETRLAARVDFAGVTESDPLEALLERRFTWRGAFAPDVGADWSAEGTRLVRGPEEKAWLAERHDVASLAVMQNQAMRGELLAWMRLSDRHPRAGLDGMDRRALRMSAPVAFAAKLALGPLWGLCDRLGMTPMLTGEARRTVTAAAIALFHRPLGESPVTSGRAYLRLWLDATARGWAGWPMAALGDDPAQAHAVASRFAIGEGRRIVQVIRFGKPCGPMPPRARRPVDEMIM